MANVGITSTSGNNSWEEFFVNTNNQVFMSVVMPEDGNITDLHCYFGGASGSVSARLCLWNSAGTLQRQSGAFTQPGGSASINGQSLASQSISSYSATSGQQLFIGFWRDPASSHVVSFNSGAGGTYARKFASSPTNTGSASTQGGKPSFYLTYTPVSPPPPPTPTGGINIWHGGSGWGKHPVKVWHGGSGWLSHPVKTWNGSSWVRRA